MKKTDKYILWAIVALSIIDGFVSSVPFIGTLTNATAEIIQGSLAAYLAFKQ
jgi:hypothetical protein